MRRRITARVKIRLRVDWIASFSKLQQNIAVIFAMQYISAAYAVAFTNAGIVLAGLLSIFAFGERERWGTRLVAIAVITCGLAVLAFSA